MIIVILINFFFIFMKLTQNKKILKYVWINLYVGVLYWFVDCVIFIYKKKKNKNVHTYGKCVLCVCMCIHQTCFLYIYFHNDQDY